MSSSGGSCSTLPEFASQFSPPVVRTGSVTSPLLTYPRPPTSTNSDDWEVQMLVEEFEKKVKEEQQSPASRRHSSYEPLSWSRVLSRNLTLGGELRRHPARTASPSPFSSQEEGRRRHLRRKHSLRDDRLLRSLASRQAAGTTDARPKLARFASLDVPRYHRQQKYVLQNHHGEEAGEPAGFPESGVSENLRSGSSRAALKRRAFWQSRQRHSTFFSGQSALGNDKQRLLGAWRSLDEECEPEDDHHRLQETSFSNECLWQPPPAYSPASTLLKKQTSTTSVSSASHIAGWPSTPCLPTIKEDTSAATGSARRDLAKARKLSSSGSRSYSENCLADADVTENLPISLTRRSSSSGGGTSSSGSSTETTIQEPLHCSQRRQQQQQCTSAPRTTVAMTETIARSTGGLTTVSAVQGKADSVAISIPDTEPIWSLP